MAMFLMCEPLRGTLTQAADDFRIIRNTYEYISVRFGGGGGLLTHYHPHPTPPTFKSVRILAATFLICGYGF